MKYPAIKLNYGDFSAGIRGCSKLSEVSIEIATEGRQHYDTSTSDRVSSPALARRRSREVGAQYMLLKHACNSR